MQVEKGGSWKGSSRFFFLFLLLRLGRTVDGRRTFYRSGLEKELSLWRDEEENSYLYLLVRCSLQLLAEPDARNYGGAKTFEMLCGALPFLLEMRFLLSRGGEGKRWQRWTWFDRRSLSLLCPFIPLSFPSPWRPHAWQPREDLLSRISRRAELPPLPMIYLSSPPHPVSPPTHTAAPPEGADDLRMCCQLLGFFLFP